LKFYRINKLSNIITFVNQIPINKIYEKDKIQYVLTYLYILGNNVFVEIQEN